MQMRGRSWRSWAWGALAAIAAAAAGPLHAQQSTGVVTGRVTEAGTGVPVAEAQVNVVGTTLGTRTGADGQYTIRGVPAGQARVRALRIGYTEASTTVAVTAGATATADIALVRSAVQLQEIVTTATGPQRAVEVGNVVNQIDAAAVTSTAPVTTVSDVLNARAPGVVITSASGTGTGSRIRIRGANSLNLSNDPIYIIDGIRMTNNSGSTGLGTGGPAPSRVNDINPDEIESIEVIKGPSAATLYGTDAANGVIVITTKRGQAGPAQWNAWGEYGVIEDRVNNYPTNYTLRGRSTPTSPQRNCRLYEVAAATCAVDSVRTYSIFDDPDATPIGTGNRYQTGLSVSGGSQQVRYFISGEREEETGVIELPAFERRRFAASDLTLHEWTERPNALTKTSVRANLNAAVTPKLDVAVNAAYIDLAQRYQLDMNATAGLGSHLFGGPGFKDNGNVGSGLGTPLNGYRAWTPGYSFQEKQEQQVDRFITGAQATYRPLSWLQGNATIGLDYTSRAETRLRLDGEGAPVNATYRDGFAQDGRASISNVTANLSGAATWQIRDWLRSTTTAGAQYVNYRFDGATAEGDDLPPGAVTAGSGAIPDADEDNTITKTLGFFLEEQFAIRERLFVTGALRSDQNSAFGTDFQSVIYPKASVSWIASEEEFFPRYGWLDQFRVRAAFGASGVQPGPNDALRTFASVNTNVGETDVPAVVYDAIGNEALKPESTTELEAGFDLRAFANRASLEFTYYHKRTRDALIEAIVPPSAGAAEDVTENLGSVRNIGFEALLTTQLVDRPAFGMDLSVNASTNDNKLVSLGDVEPIIEVTSRTIGGYPLFSYWGQKVTYEDKNGDGLLFYSADEARNEVFVADSATFIGEANAKHNVSTTLGLEFLDRRLRIQTLVDWRGGFHWYNNTERIRCASRANCSGLNNPNASLEDQAAAVALLQHPARTLSGYIQQGDFVRLREISATYRLPETLLDRVGGLSSASLNLSARNIALWTDYRGIDPESFRGAGSSTNAGDDFQGLGPPSYFILRLNVGF